MIWDPSLFHYACIAKGTTVLAEFNPKDAALGAIAAKCLEKTPPFHATFTHTVRSKTYAFLIDDPFVYFLISDEKLEKSEGLAFLKSVRDAFVEDFQGQSRLEKLTSHCFQGEFSPVFRQLLAPAMYIIDGIESPIGQRIGESGRIAKASGDNGTNKMKNRFLEGVIGRRNKEVDENNGNGSVFSPEFSHKNRGFYSNDHQKAKKVWKKQVWIVLLLDLMACMILFVVWLWICSGLKCMER
ncbi:hypothetical protein ACS0TY_000075 [Phlomoides rotata]